MLVQQLPELPPLVWAFALIPAVAAGLWHPRWLLVFFLLAGFFWACFRADVILRERLPAELEGRDLVVEGVVADIPDPTDYGMRFLFDVERARADGVSVSVPSRIRMTTHGVDLH